MKKMTVHEAEWYGAECGTQDAMNGSLYRPRKWAKREDFVHHYAWTQFRRTYDQAYHQTREDLLHAEKFDT